MFMLHNKVLDVLLLRSLQLGFCLGGCMKLRAHPLMSYRGVSNWPPVWVGTNHKNEPLRGEVGVLEDVVPSQTENSSRFFLRIEDEGWGFLPPNLQTNDCTSRRHNRADR